MKKSLFIIGTIVLFAVSCTFEKGEVPKAAASIVNTCTTTISYSLTIAPLITTHCGDIDGTNTCHGTGNGPGNHEFTILSVLQGDVASITDRVIQGHGNPMPASGPLADSLKNKLNCWINQGALNN